MLSKKQISKVCGNNDYGLFLKVGPTKWSCKYGFPMTHNVPYKMVAINLNLWQFNSVTLQIMKTETCQYYFTGAASYDALGGGYKKSANFH